MRRVLPLVIGAALVFPMACGPSGPTQENNAVCKTRITGSSSPAPGFLTLTGQFYPDETVRLQHIVNGQFQTDALGTPASARTSFTLNPLPSGTRTYDVVISCEGGQQDLGNMDFTVQ